MINCPNCDKQIADDAAHCGYCGHQLEKKSKKKTMFGMAALGGDKLKKAVEEAKKAKEGQNDGEQSSDTQSGGGLKIPKPGQKSADTPSRTRGSAFKVPKPGESTSAQPQSSGARASEPSEDDPLEDESLQEESPQDESQRSESPQDESQRDEPALAKTERIDLSDAKPPSEVSEPSNANTQPHDFQQRLAQQQRLQTDESLGDEAETGATVGMSAPSPDDFDTIPSSEPAGPSPSQNAQAGDQSGLFGPGAQKAEKTAPSWQLGSGSAPNPSASTPAGQQGGIQVHKVGTGGPPAPERKSKKGLIIGLVLAAMALGGACMLGAAYYLFTNFF